jgi:hypothetical protein
LNKKVCANKAGWLTSREESKGLNVITDWGFWLGKLISSGCQEIVNSRKYNSNLQKQSTYNYVCVNKKTIIGASSY